MSGDGPDPKGDGAQVGRMQAGVRDWVLRSARSGGRGLRELSPSALLSLLCAAAFCPLVVVAAGITGTAAVAGIGVLSSVGGGVLSDVVIKALDRLRGQDGENPPAPGEIEEAVAGEIGAVLASGDAAAAALRAEIGLLLGHIDASGTMLRAAVESGSERVRGEVIAMFGVLGSGFAELGFLIEDVAEAAAEIQQGLDEQGANVRVIIEQNVRQSAEIRRAREELAVLERRTRTAGDRAADVQGPVREGCPYRGLLPFGEADAEVFYGRERLTTELAVLVAGRVSSGGLVFVTGASGAGKSSLLRAGLLPALARGLQVQGSDVWPCLVMTPASDPLTELAAQLAALSGADAAAVRDGLARDPGRAYLAVRQAVLADAARHQWPAAGGRGASRLVLVVDQFEQLFTLNAGPAAEADRLSFITALAAMATSPAGEPAALVVIAVRGDYCDRCAAYPELADAMQESQFVVGPMIESDLRLAITGPANMAGLRIDAGLTDVILGDLRVAGTGEAAGVLPLLSQAMLLTWENRDGDRLTTRGYGAAGGVSRAVQVSADAVYDALAAADQALAREVLRSMAVVGRDGRLTRRPVTRAALAGLSGPGQSGAETVLERFAVQRLVVLNDGTAELAHDAILTAWPRLRGWLEDDQASWHLHSQLGDDAAEWRGSLDSSDFLYRGAQLAAVQHAVRSWAASQGRYPVLTSIQQEFLQASQRASTRRSRQRRVVAAALAVLLVAALTSAGLAAAAAGNARRESSLATGKARIAAAGELAAESEELGPTDPVTAAQLAAAAWKIAPTAQARASMLEILALPERATLTAVVGSKISKDVYVAFSPGGKILATGGGDGTLRLWDMATDREIGSPILAVGPSTDDLVSRNSVDAVAFSPGGGSVATAGTDGTVRLWDVATHRQIGSPIVTSGEDTLAFSPGGKLLAAGGGDGTVRLWDVATHQEVGSPIAVARGGDPTKSSVTSVAFSPGGSILATGADDGTARLWDVATHREVGSAITAVSNPGGDGPSGGNGVNAVAFSPGGSILATGGDDGTARLWDVATHREVGSAITAAGGEPVEAVAFSPSDGGVLATGGQDGTARVWAVASHLEVGAPLKGIGPFAEAVSFSPDGATLATGGIDGTAQLWNLGIYQQIGPAITAVNDPGDESGGRDGVNAVAFSPGGGILATGGDDGTARLWDVATHREIGSPITAVSGTNEEVETIAFSPKGDIMATAGADNTVRLWDVATHREMGQPIVLGPYDTIVWTVAFNPQGSILATGDDNGTVRLWDVATHREIGPVISAVSSVDQDDVNAVAFSPGGGTLATGEGDGTVRLWDVGTHREIGPPIAAISDEASNTVSAVAFSPGGQILATVGTDGTARLWDVATHRQIGPDISPSNGNGLNTLAFSPSGSVLATAGGDGKARLWDIAFPGDLLRAVCAIAGTSLTYVQWHAYIQTEPYQHSCP